MTPPTKKHLSPAILVIILFGFISMFGDMVYESARSANSQYLNLLGVSAATVGLVFGIGEFLGYALRLVSGLLSDKTSKHWLFLMIGYGMLISVPIMGLTRHWPLLLVLILMERIGKALRNPSKDTIVSQVAQGDVGVGFAFGLQEALDQVGAFAGPLIFTLVFYLSGGQGIAQYQSAYRWLLVPFIMLMAFLVYVQRKTTAEGLIKAPAPSAFRSERLQPVFWWYSAFTFLATLGFVNFSLIGFHLKANNLLPDGQITLLYSIAMAVDALSALLVGRWYDRLKQKNGRHMDGLGVLVGIPLLSMALPLLTLTRSVPLIVAGMVIFGIVMGTHETVMRSAIADLTPFSKRGTAYGVFNTIYGLGFLAGAALMGWLYDHAYLNAINALSIGAEIAAFVVFIILTRSVHALSGTGSSGNAA